MRALPALCLIVAGCATHDMTVMSEFRPAPDGTFIYQSAADVVYPDGDPQAEAARIARLELYMRDNGICPVGYTITSRQAVTKGGALLGTPKDIFYQGRCA